MDKILVVIVLYMKPWEETSLYRILMGKQIPNLEIIIYDNSPQRQEITVGFDNIQYHHDEKNGMIGAAYNFAYKTALKKDKSWILLLDQDTEFEFDYLELLEKTTSTLKGNSEYVAIVPKVESHGRIVSPSVVNSFGIIRPFHNKKINHGKKTQITAINSGTLLKVDFINSIGGFSKHFKLDMLDHSYFKEIHNNNKKVLLLEYTLYHDLSVMNYNKGVSHERYKILVQSERYYYREYYGVLVNIIYKFRLMIRFLKHLMFVRNKRIALTTFKCILGKKIM